MTDEQPEQGTERDPRTGRRAAAARIAQQSTWVDLQIRQAMERGAFDGLPGQGKPIDDLGARHDPDWWLKKLVEREQIALLPASLQLRKDDAELDAHLDTLNVEAQVRREVEEFNERVLRARYRPAEGPPLVTQPRDVEQTVAAWAARRAERRSVALARAAAGAAEEARRPAPSGRWSARIRRWLRPAPRPTE